MTAKPNPDVVPGVDAARDVERRERIADERERLADARDRALTRRERRAEARETAQADRSEHEQDILAGAADRDDDADARDSVADERDESVSRAAFVADRDYGPALAARRSAAVDRLLSKTDRTSSAEDRANLTGRPPATDN